MPLLDTKGVAWAHTDTVKAGDKLRCDGGFTCLSEGQIVEVCTYHGHLGDDARSRVSRLYVPCSDGEHFLDGQIGDDGELVGLYVEKAADYALESIAFMIAALDGIAAYMQSVLTLST